MKKFTCLLVALLATQMIYTACPGEATNAAAGNSFQAMLKASTDFTGVTPAGAITAAAGTSTPGTGATICNNEALCCTASALQAFVNTRLTNLKTALTTFGTAVSKFGGYIAKIAAVANNTNISTYLTSATTDLAITDVQAKAFLTQYATPATYTADFTAFTGQLVDCFNYYQQSYQKIACHACSEGVAAAAGPPAVVATKSQAAFWQGGGAANMGVAGAAGVTTVGEITIPQASCNEWATKCNKVWAFLHRVGGAVHVAAYINKKRDSTKSAVPSFTAAYVAAADQTAVTAIITAVTNCAADATVATCLAADKTALCTGFIRAFDASAPIARLDVTNINADPTSSYPTSRRQLVTASSGKILVVATDGVDLTATNTVTLALPATGAVTFASSDFSAWSAGYVAPASGSGSSSASGSTTSSAKVVIGTILSALFAIAFLN